MRLTGRVENRIAKDFPGRDARVVEELLAELVNHLTERGDREDKERIAAATLCAAAAAWTASSTRSSWPRRTGGTCWWARDWRTRAGGNAWRRTSGRECEGAGAPVGARNSQGSPKDASGRAWSLVRMHGHEHGHRPRTPEAERTRRWFMNKALLAGGVAAVATMTGCSAGSSDTASSSSSSAAASNGAPSGAPSGGPGGGAGGMGPGASEVKYADFVGVTTDGEVAGDLYSIHSTDVSTDKLVKAAQAFLDGLTTKERKASVFDVDDDEWLKWSNVDGYERQGARMGDLTEKQRALGYALLGAALSADGLTQTRNIMKLNAFLGDYNGGGKDTLTEGAYFFTFMGTPSTSKPWGFQYEGHHVAVNYFVLGDQVVMTPTFMGSEPTSATYDGEKITLFKKETEAGLALLRSLTAAQRKKVVSSEAKSGDNMKAGAGQDNLKLAYQGLAAADWSDTQRDNLLDLVRVYVGNLADGHAEVKMREVEDHLDDTYFHWIGETEDSSAFYYRVHSPVVLIEYDAQSPSPTATRTAAAAPAAPPPSSTSTPSSARPTPATTAWTSSSCTWRVTTEQLTGLRGPLTRKGFDSTVRPKF